jgi:hypothetical protein
MHEDNAPFSQNTKQITKDKQIVFVKRLSFVDQDGGAALFAVGDVDEVEAALVARQHAKVAAAHNLQAVAGPRGGERGLAAAPPPCSSDAD